MVLSKALNLGKNLADVFCFRPVELPGKKEMHKNKCKAIISRNSWIKVAYL
jgi:hypothetical protein